MDRRTLFKRTLVGGALVTFGGGTLLAVRRGPEIDGTPLDLVVLDTNAFRVLVALAEVSIPCSRPMAIEVARRVDIALSYGAPRAQNDLKEGLFVVENALIGIFIRLQVTPFSALDLDGRKAALEALRDSPSKALRGAYNALRRLCAASYYAGEKEAKETGYPGPPFEKPPAPPIDARTALSPPFVVVGAESAIAPDGTAPATKAPGGGTHVPVDGGTR